MTNDQIRHQLMERIRQLPREKLLALEVLLSLLESSGSIHLGPEPAVTRLASESESKTQELSPRDWPHAPIHRLSEHGTYLVTAGTLYKQHFFHTTRQLDLLEEKLLELARQYGWQLEAWAVFSNHYHFVGHSQATSGSLSDFLGELHYKTATAINKLDQMAGRQVWHNFWETRLTHERSYLARLNYVHHNAVKHGLVAVANQYRWCSADWFERTAKPAQVKTIYGFKTDKLHILDDFEVCWSRD